MIASFLPELDESKHEQQHRAQRRQRHALEFPPDPYARM